MERLAHDEHAAAGGLAIHRQTVDVDAVRKALCAEHFSMVASGQLAIHERCDLTASHIINREAYLAWGV